MGNANLNPEFYFAVDTMIQIKYHCLDFIYCEEDSMSNRFRP